MRTEWYICYNSLKEREIQTCAVFFFWNVTRSVSKIADSDAYSEVRPIVICPFSFGNFFCLIGRFILMERFSSHQNMRIHCEKSAGVCFWERPHSAPHYHSSLSISVQLFQYSLIGIIVKFMLLSENFSQFKGAIKAV